MATYSKPYTLDFTDGGDTVYQGCDKLEDDIDQLVTDLNACHMTTRGDMIYRSGSAVARLAAPSTVGSILRHEGTGGDPVWSDSITIDASGDIQVKQAKTMTVASSATLTIAANATLDVSAGTLTLSTGQISGDSISGGTVSSLTINTLTVATSIDVSAATFTLANDQISGDKVSGGTIDSSTLTGGLVTSCNITVPSGKTLDVSGGTLTLANDQISGDKIEGGTIGSITIGTLTVTSLSGSVTVSTGATLDVSNGTLTLAANQIAWDRVDKANSSLADLGTRSAGDLTTGTLAMARMPASGTWTLSGALQISGSQKILIGTSANTKTTSGVTIDQGAADDQVIAFGSSDVAHGVTDLADNRTYGFIRKQSATDGGLHICGLAGQTPIKLRAIASGVMDTGKTQSATASVMVDILQKSGTGTGAVDANSNVFAVRCYPNGGTGVKARFMVDEDGDCYYASSISAFDEYDDALACRDLAKVLAGDDIRKKFEQTLTYNAEIFRRLGVVHYEDGTGGSEDMMISVKGVTALQLGAIGQLYEVVRALCSRVGVDYELVMRGRRRNAQIG